ncbi:hypothetical protein Y697_05070 [Mesotoga sp. BH458_6_3_2_1]|nr:hypothetical protein Y697_05070 [Mesotoga sp. BH458_6_3_2_1]
MTVLEASKGAIFMGWHLDYSESSTSRHLDKTGRELRYELREEEKERSQSAYAGQFRLRRTKRAAWIRNAEGCRLGKALQEVMRRRSPAEVMLLRRRPVRSAVNGPPLMFQNRFCSPDPRSDNNSAVMLDAAEETSFGRIKKTIAILL